MPVAVCGQIVEFSPCRGYGTGAITDGSGQRSISRRDGRLAGCSRPCTNTIGPPRRPRSGSDAPRIERRHLARGDFYQQRFV
jgi:hypothetical protein